MSQEDVSRDRTFSTACPHTEQNLLPNVLLNTTSTWKTLKIVVDITSFYSIDFTSNFTPQTLPKKPKQQQKQESNLQGVWRKQLGVDRRGGEERRTQVSAPDVI